MTQPFNIDPSVTTTFSAINENATQQLVLPDDFSAVVIGGGSGSPASIKTLLSLGISTDAVVAMADDGGSTGDLRQSADVTPPGDIRKCICAFAEDNTDPLTKAFKYRFPIANNHTLGNLMLAALEDASGSFPLAIEICEKLLHCKGHVYPSTLDKVHLKSITQDGQVLEGQAVSCKSNTALSRVALIKDDSGDIEPFQGAIDAIKNSNLIVLGPGSLFTSIIPNLLVPGIVDAIARSKAAVVFVCGIADIQGETWGLSAKEHIDALLGHGMENLIDYCLIHCPSKSSLQEQSVDQDKRFVTVSESDVQEIQSMGPVVVLRDLANEKNSGWHDGEALREAFSQIISMVESRKSF